VNGPPALSVVVALISGEVEDLRHCLQALHAQDSPLAFEVIVPYDPPVADVLRLQAEFPAVRFLPAEGIDTAAARRGASREHHDTLRTIGLRAARSSLVVLTEDHAHVARDWCREMVAALERHPLAAAVGGAVECGSTRLLNRAVYYCDFGRYQNPLPEGPAEFVSDSNVAYRRDLLEEIRDVWQGDYHETEVHWALVRSGRALVTTPRVIVWQSRGALGLGAALRERYVWAKSFAGTRVRGASAGRRLVLAALSPLLPFVLTARLVRGASARGRASELAGALPLVFVLECAWGLGELAGYASGRP